MPPLPDVAPLAGPLAGPLAARLLAGLLGLALLLRGAHLYRLAVVAPGALAGTAAGVALGGAMSLPPLVTLGAALVAAGIGAAVCALAEAVAVRLAGVVVGVAATIALAPLFSGAPAPWWASVAGALGGLVVFPTLYRRALPAVTALLGAAAVVWALGMQASPLALLGVAGAGLVVQGMFGGKRRKGVEEE